VLRLGEGAGTCVPTTLSLLAVVFGVSKRSMPVTVTLALDESGLGGVLRLIPDATTFSAGDATWSPMGENSCAVFAPT